MTKCSYHGFHGPSHRGGSLEIHLLLSSPSSPVGLLRSYRTCLEVVPKVVEVVLNVLEVVVEVVLKMLSAVVEVALNVLEVVLKVVGDCAEDA